MPGNVPHTYLQGLVQDALLHLDLLAAHWGVQDDLLLGGKAQVDVILDAPQQQRPNDVV